MPDAQQLQRQITACARLCDPANGAPENERGIAARTIETLLPRLVSELTSTPKAPPAPEARHPAQSPLERLQAEWRRRFPASVAEARTLLKFSQGMSWEQLTEAMDITAAKADLTPDARFRYFCGVCWRCIRAAA